LVLTNLEIRQLLVKYRKIKDDSFKETPEQRYDYAEYERNIATIGTDITEKYE